MDVSKILTSAVSNMGARIDLVLKTAGEPIEIGMNVDTLQAIVQDLAGVVAKARKMGDPEGIRPAPTPAKFPAGLTEDGSILVSFQLKNELEFHFALPTSDAARLQAYIGKALQTHKQARH